MKNINRNISVFARNFTPINFCGKPIMWQTYCRIYEPPYETEPTTGEHDFNTCEDCQNNLRELREDFELRFNGTKEKSGFPLCCERHAELAKLQVFNINDFKQVPDWTSKKIVYTSQHIKNHIFTDDYYKDITDYIDYTIDSFGQTPNDSEPLYLGSYLSCVTGIISNSENIPKEKKDRLLEYLKSFDNHKDNERTDFNILIGTYEKWFKAFPWQMSFFASLKPQFEKLPIIQSVSQTNKYSGKTTAKSHTKSSLIKMLVNTTNNILTQINSLALYEKGLLTDPQQVKLDLIINERRLKIQQGYTNSSPDESQRYRNILKAWFADEKKFIDEMTPLLSTSQPQSYNGMAEALTKYVKGASDADLQTIIEHKTLPIGATVKEWVGAEADAHRFCHRYGLKNADFKKCFGKEIKAGNKKGIEMELNGSIWDIISQYPQ